MFYIYKNDTNEFSHETVGQANPKKKGEYLVPSFSTSVKPPVIPKGKQAVYSLGTWVLLDDNRDKDYWSKTTREKVSFELGDKIDSSMTNIQPVNADYEWDVDDWKLSDSAILNQWKANRSEAVSNIEVTHNDVVYQGDEESQTRMSRAIIGLPDDVTTIPWTAKDNSPHELTRVDLTSILNLAGTAQTVIWNEGRPS